MEETARRAVLFADVCDSTAIYESAGDQQALALVNRLFAQLKMRVQAAGGLVVKTLGDGMVCMFDDPDAAFRAACDMQAATIAMPTPAGLPKLAIKVAWTWGPVVLEDDDVFGDTVNVCARLAAVANRDQVLTTGETVEALHAGLRLRCRALQPIKVKGREGKVTMCEVLWRGDADVTAVDLSGGAAADPAARWQMKLAYAGNSLVVGVEASVTIGRDAGNQLVVASSLASRVHARVFQREGNFFIADQSANGTYLLVDGAASEIRLRREEALMGERGWIGLGKSAATHGPHMVRYRLERSKS